MIQSIELVSGNIYKTTIIEELDKEKLLKGRLERINAIVAHQTRVDTLKNEVADIDTKLSLLLKNV